METVHGHHKIDYVNLTGKKNTNTCSICGTNLSRIDNLNEHIQHAHLNQSEKFVCPFCEKKFDRKWNLKRHEPKCALKNTNLLEE
jgi:uncharacterized Zn-finger protein